MFADTELASCIESAEARLTKDAVQSVNSADHDGKAFVHQSGNGVAAFIRSGSPMNKVVGVGIDHEIEDQFLIEIEDLYRARNEAVRIELSTLAIGNVGRRLTERGYRLLGFENVLGRPLGREITAALGGVRIERVTTNAHLEMWKEVTVTGFAHPDETGIVVDSFSRDVIKQAINDIVQSPGYERYLAFKNDEIAGAASLRIDKKVALLTGATTLPEYRRVGIQGALLAQRLADANDRGSEIAVITTGGGTRSQANAMRRGFSLLYSRAILVREF